MTKNMLERQPIRTMLALALSSAVMSCGDGSAPMPSGTNAAEDIERVSGRVEPTSAPPRDEAAKVFRESVDVDDAARPLRIEVVSGDGYTNADGKVILDVLEGESVYPTLSIQDAEGRPVRGVRPAIRPERDSRFVPLGGEAAASNELGIYPFGLTAGTMGEDRVEIVAGEATQALILNVISQRATGYAWIAEIEGVLDWQLLFRAEVQWGEQHLSATFPDEVLARSGRTVKLAGFMMPLEPTRRQSHFVLTSNPSDCFFHVPGGPTGAVEVFAKKPLSVSWDPIVLEGRFEAIERSEIGVVYRLHEARAIDPEPRASGQ